MEFKILNWNIGGAKYLEETKEKRKKTLTDLNKALRTLIEGNNKPDVITLQEIVRYGKSSKDASEIINPIKGYKYFSFPLIDSDSLSSKDKWEKVKKLGGWPRDTFFAQGNAFLFRNDVPHFPVWDLSSSSECRPKKPGHFVEQVILESGLYFGDRNTEPRAALIAHFIYNPTGKNGKPLDIFVINVHLTTLMMEREGIPDMDLTASDIRQNHLSIIFRKIISRYNIWKRLGFPIRGKIRKLKEWRAGESADRFEPVWILAGDFNFTPESVEYERIMKMNFIDVVPGKGSGTKAKGVGNPATLTLDYIFAGPKFISLDPLIAASEITDNFVDHSIKASDHYPMCANIPFTIPKEKNRSESDRSVTVRLSSNEQAKSQNRKVIGRQTVALSESPGTPTKSLSK